MNCGSCRWWSPDHVLGQCRRYPQIVTKHHTDWCGEYRPSELPIMSLTTPQAEPPPKRRGRPPKTKPA